MSEFRFNDEPLKQFLKGLLKAKDHAARVGVMGDRDAREEGEMGNAEIGAAHELGSPSRGLPARSWLRMPISWNAEPIAINAKQAFIKTAQTGNIVDFLRQLGIAAEAAISQAFDSGGFGTWAPLAASTLKARLRIGELGRLSIFQRRQMLAEQLHEGARHATILVDTKQLRFAVTSRVV